MTRYEMRRVQERAIAANGDHEIRALANLRFVDPRDGDIVQRQGGIYVNQNLDTPGRQMAHEPPGRFGNAGICKSADQCANTDRKGHHEPRVNKDDRQPAGGLLLARSAILDDSQHHR
jgi:hypothetical protein